MASEGGTVPQLVESITQSSPSAYCSLPMAGGDISSNVHTSPCHKVLDLDEQTKKELCTDTFCKVCGAVLQFESQRISHYEGKKHALKVRLYLQNVDPEETASKKNRSDRVDFHVDGGSAQDKNKFCSLCNMVFSSPVVAKSHYVGKTHAKKLRQFSGEHVEWAAQPHRAYYVTAPLTHPADTGKTVQPMSAEKPNQQEASTEQHSSTDNEIDLNDPDKYCKLCCASFNKSLVAQQHYSGKKHARNEARRRMMEELEGPGVEGDSGVSNGTYVCPICSVTLTSIEMYQSHMQGNKHHVKENMVANLMKTTKKSYDSFQDELDDYIKVQKARGLEPKTQFRQEKEQYDSCEYEEEEIEDRLPPEPFNYKTGLPYRFYDPHSMPYPPFNSPHLADPRKGAWPSPRENVCRPQNLNKAPYFQNSQYNAHTPSSQGSSEDYKGSSSDDSIDCHRKEKKYKRKHRKEGKRKGTDKFKGEDETIEKKKRKLEEVDLEKDYGEDKPDCKKDETELSAVDKSKHKKEKKKKEEPPVDKESKKHKKVKKEGDQRTEEEMLWDESILGF
ncbi:lysine-rich coiled-coil protein 1 isoform 2-T2 [Pelodytes ibericus]